MALSDRPYGPNSGNPSGLSTETQNVQGEGPAPLPALQLVVSATEVKILNPAQPALALSIAIPPNTTLEQTVFDLYVSGYIKTTASGTLALAVYADALATVTSGNLLHKTASAVTQNSATAPFSVHLRLQYDSVSGKLTGTGESNINNVIDPAIAITNVPTGISNTNDPVLSFSLTLTSSGALTTAITTINVQKFSVG